MGLRAIPLGVLELVLSVLSSESTHPSLLERVRSLGDQAAWAEFDLRYRDLLLSYAMRRGLQATDAEDLRQEVMLRLTQRLPEFEYRPDRGRFRDYLGRIVRNSVFRRLARQNGLPRKLVVDDEDLPAADDLDEAWNEEWTLHHYRRAMQRVRQQFRPESLTIFDGLLEGRSAEQLAEQFATSPMAVYKVKQRIRDRLRELIQAQIHDEEFRERQPSSP